MNFRRGWTREEPEINLIPMIDVLLVILIFLMVTTTYSHFTALQVRLPEGMPGSSTPSTPRRIEVTVDVAGHIFVDQQLVADGADLSLISRELTRAAQGQKDPFILISADRDARHGHVVTVMEAAQQAGYRHLAVMTRAPVR